MTIASTSPSRPGAVLANDDSAGPLLFLGTTLTYGCSEAGYSSAGGTWMSADGTTWMRLPFGEHATIGGAELIGGRYVVVTHAGTGMARDAGISMWLSDR